MENISDNFSVLSLNVQSLKGKWSEFRDFVDELNTGSFKFSVIGIQEIWSLGGIYMVINHYYPNFVPNQREAPQI